MKQTHATSFCRHNSLTPFIRNFRDLASLFIILISLICGGCFRQFYSTNTVSHFDSATLMKLIDAKKYFIYHDLSNNKVYALYNVRLSNDRLAAETGPLFSEHTYYENPSKSDGNVFPAKLKGVVLFEVHLYAQNSVNDSVHVNIPLKDFSRVDVYELDKERTRSARVGSIIGITLSTAAVVVVIAAIADASKTPAPVTTTPNSQVSCSPLVYITDHNQNELQGTLYSGAIAASLERTDYMPISITKHMGDKIRLTIKGKDEEDIMLNQVQLLQVKHKKSEQVLIDRKGQILVYHDPVKPVRALIGPNHDVSSDISTRDGKYYSFTNRPGDGNSSDILINFSKPGNCTSGKLIVNAKNSNWSYYLFNQFKSLYGDYYPSLIEKKDKSTPAQVMQCELDQYLPLLVSVKYNNGWKYIDYFPTIGISNSRDLIMKLNLEEFKDSNNIQLRLQTTYMFWDIDYVAMDFSTKNLFQDELISASQVSLVNRENESTCTDNAGQHSNIVVKGPLRLDLEFDVHSSAAVGTKNSYFLVGNGYYHDNARFEGKARYEELSRFSGKGAFDKYSREKFEFLLNVMRENEHPGSSSY